MNQPLPHRYELELAWRGGSLGELSAGDRPKILGGPPPQFGGSAERWSPEHLLLASASLCLMATFMAGAARSGLQVGDYRCAAEGTLGRTPDGAAFTEIVLRVTLRVAPEDGERALRALEQAKRFCIVSNSLKAPVKVEGTVEALEKAPGGGT